MLSIQIGFRCGYCHVCFQLHTLLGITTIYFNTDTSRNELTMVQVYMTANYLFQFCCQYQFFFHTNKAF